MDTPHPPSDPPRFEHPHCVTREGYSVMLARYSPGMAMGRHAHDGSAVSIVLAGGVEETVTQSRFDATAGAVLVKPRGTYHANQFSPDGASILCVALEGDGDPYEPPAGTCLSRWGTLRSFGAYRCAVDLLVSLRGGNASEADDAVHDLFAALLHHTEPFARFAGPRWLPDVRAELDEHPGQRSVGEIARSLGLHPTYLTRRFRAEYGCSVTQYRRRVRLLSAAQALASPAMSLARAAYQQGFADQSHLCREVRRELGVTPSALRELIGG